VSLYLDSSALVKLVQHEAESEALRRYLRAHASDQRVASELVRLEVVRSVLRGGPAAVAHARRQLARLYLVVMDRQVLDQAATLAPGSLLRSLDAIHLATAQLLGSELRSIVTYDARMAEAATGLGLSVAAPTGAVQ
jgi:predicted nucleic acid-binding protein